MQLIRLTCWQTKLWKNVVLFIHLLLIHPNDLSTYYGLGTMLDPENKIAHTTKSLPSWSPVRKTDDKLVSKYLTHCFPPWSGRGELEKQKLVKIKAESPRI